MAGGGVIATPQRATAANAIAAKEPGPTGKLKRTFYFLKNRTSLLRSENENLDLAEDVDYHILLDWSHPNPQFAVTIRDGIFVCNGYFIWNRLREVVAKFITGIGSFIAFANNAASFSVSCRPELGSIAPDRRPRGS